MQCVQLALQQMDTSQTCRRWRSLWNLRKRGQARSHLAALLRVVKLRLQRVLCGALLLQLFFDLCQLPLRARAVARRLLQLCVHRSVVALPLLRERAQAANLVAQRLLRCCALALHAQASMTTLLAAAQGGKGAQHSQSC